MKYNNLKDHQWETPLMKGYRLRCCDCCLTHVITFKIKNGTLSFKAVRDNRATAAARRGKLASEYKKALLDTADKQVKQIAKAASQFKDLPLAKKPALSQARRKR